MVGRSDRAAKIISRSILLINSDGKIALLSISGLSHTFQELVLDGKWGMSSC